MARIMLLSSHVHTVRHIIRRSRIPTYTRCPCYLPQNHTCTQTPTGKCLWLPAAIPSFGAMLKRIRLMYSTNRLIIRSIYRLNYPSRSKYGCSVISIIFIVHLQKCITYLHCCPVILLSDVNVLPLWFIIAYTYSWIMVILIHILISFGISITFVRFYYYS